MLMAIMLSGPSLKAADQPAYGLYFEQSKGFKPAQANFQSIILQMAGSFEASGTPEPYLRHVMIEDRRISAKYRLATGRDGSRRPSYFTDEYLEKLLKNWNRMAPVLSLEDLTRETGRNIRHALMGSWNMSVAELVALQDSLTEKEASVYRDLLRKDYFTKADFPAMEGFYKTAFGKLTEEGKAQISRRTRWGQLAPDKRAEAIANDKGGTVLLAILKEHQRKSLAFLENEKAPKADFGTLQSELFQRLKLNEDHLDLNGLQATERDALIYGHSIQEAFQKRITQVRAQAKQPSQAQTIESYLTGMASEILMVVQMEFQLALREGWADQKLKKNELSAGERGNTR